jgi:hypothetical protein
MVMATNSSNCKQQTRSLVREGAGHQQTRDSLTVTKGWCSAPDRGITPKQTGRLTSCHNITLTLTLSELRASMEFGTVGGSEVVAGKVGEVPVNNGRRGHYWEQLRCYCQ